MYREKPSLETIETTTTGSSAEAAPIRFCAVLEFARPDELPAHIPETRVGVTPTPVVYLLLLLADALASIAVLQSMLVPELGIVKDVNVIAKVKAL